MYWAYEEKKSFIFCRYLGNLCFEGVHSDFASSALNTSIDVYSELWLFKLDFWNTAKIILFTVSGSRHGFELWSASSVISTREHYQLHC